MTEHSYFYDGTTKGDAQEAPYTSDLFSSIISTLYGADVSLSVPVTVTVTGANMNLNASNGIALVAGRYVVLGGGVYTVPNNTSTLTRIDRLVIQLDYTHHTGRLVLKQGEPNYAPEPAVLVKNNTIYEVPIYRINVTPGVTAIQSYDVIDEREIFSILDWGYILYTYTQFYNENIMPNSEFIAGAGTSFDTAPAMWNVVATGTCTPHAKFDDMARGSSVKVTCPVNGDGISTTVSRLANGETLYYTLRLMIDVLEGAVLIGTGGGGASALIYPTSGPTEVIIRRTWGSADKDLELTVVRSSTSNTVFRLGQVTLCQGYGGVKYMPKKETILFSKPVSISGVFIPGAILVTLYTDTIELASPLYAGLSAAIVRMDLSDHGSSGAAISYGSIRDTVNAADQLRLELVGVPNDKQHSVQGFIGLPFDATGIQSFNFKTETDGFGGVITASLYYLGCRT